MFLITHNKTLLMRNQSQLQSRQLPTNDRFLNRFEESLFLPHILIPNLHFLKGSQPILILLISPQVLLSGYSGQLFRYVELQLLGDIAEHDGQIITVMTHSFNERMFEYAADVLFLLQQAHYVILVLVDQFLDVDIDEILKIMYELQ